MLAPLADDLNTPGAIAGLHALADAALAGSSEAVANIKAAGRILGILNSSPLGWFQSVLKGNVILQGDIISESLNGAEIDALIAERRNAREARDFAQADEIRKRLADQGIVLEDNAGGTTWRRA